MVSVYIQWYWLSSLSIPILYYLIVALCIHCMNKMELMGKQTPTFTSSHILWLIWTSFIIKEGILFESLLYMESIKKAFFGKAEKPFTYIKFWFSARWSSQIDGPQIERHYSYHPKIKGRNFQNTYSTTFFFLFLKLTFLKNSNLQR